jgi:predicted ribosome quality control (RQC) complex YloA/Tae2 family protein
MADAVEAGPSALLTWLWGARVQRIDAPEPSLFALTLYDRGEKCTLLLALEPQRSGVGIVASRPQGLPASAFVRRLRGLFENAQLERIVGHGGADPLRAAALALHFVRRGERARLIAEFDTRSPNLLIVAEDGRIVGAADEATRRVRFATAQYTPPTHAGPPIPADPESAIQAGAALLQGRAQQGEDSQRASARTQAKAALKRAERKLNAISADLARAEAAPALRREANVLLCYLAAIPRGASSVELEALDAEPPELLRISLDPALSAEQNAERKFSRARRLSRGVAIASERLLEAGRETAALRGFLTALDDLPLEALVELARPLGIALRSELARGKPRREPKAVHVPYRVFAGSAGARILVGKGAADNDTLTLTIAKPHDLWLHARNLQGAHVVVQRQRQQPVAPEALLDAAHLAAHFSAARGEPSVEIQHTERRYVRKPKGSAPGAVRLDRERTLLLRVEPERLKRLLLQERGSSELA